MRTRGAGLVIVALATGCHTSPVQPCATAGLSRIAPNPQPPAPIPQLDSIFRAAGAEFHVSPSLLSGIGWVETRWQMVQGAEEFPGRPAAFGVMGLRGAALERGAALAGVTIEAARQDHLLVLGQIENYFRHVSWRPFPENFAERAEIALRDQFPNFRNENFPDHNSEQLNRRTARAAEFCSIRLRGVQCVPRLEFPRNSPI